MTKRQIAKYGMFHIILHFLLRHLEIVKKVPALLNAVNTFQGHLIAIDSIAPKVAKKTTGPAAAKKILRTYLQAQALTISSLLYAFASATKNEELKKKINYKKRELDALAHEELVPVCKVIGSIARQYLAELKDYLVTEALLSSFEESIGQFQDIMTKPQMEETDKSVAAKQAAGYFDQCDDLLDNHIDRMALSLKETDPEFYAGYKKNRKLNDPATRHTRITGQVNDKPAGTAMAGVIVLHELTGLKTITDEKGQFVLPLPLTGKQMLVFMKEEYEPVKSLVELKLGQTSTVTISMEVVK